MEAEDEMFPMDTNKQTDRPASSSEWHHRQITETQQQQQRQTEIQKKTSKLFFANEWRNVCHSHPISIAFGWWHGTIDSLITHSAGYYKKKNTLFTRSHIQFDTHIRMCPPDKPSHQPTNQQQQLNINSSERA